jgi:hypothetical protein
MAEEIRKGGATRRPTPLSIEVVPRHAVSRMPAAASLQSASFARRSRNPAS